MDGITVDLMTRVLSHVLSGYTEVGHYAGDDTSKKAPSYKHAAFIIDLFLLIISIVHWSTSQKNLKTEKVNTSKSTCVVFTERLAYHMALDTYGLYGVEYHIVLPSNAKGNSTSTG